jgi:hypothetical protein
VASNHFNLQRIEKKSRDTFREYAQLWRERVAWVQLPMSKKEMVRLFIDTLKDLYFDRLIRFSTDFILISERINML